MLGKNKKKILNGTDRVERTLETNAREEFQDQRKGDVQTPARTNRGEAASQKESELGLPCTGKTNQTNKTHSSIGKNCMGLARKRCSQCTSSLKTVILRIRDKGPVWFLYIKYSASGSDALTNCFLQIISPDLTQFNKL